MYRSNSQSPLRPLLPCSRRDVLKASAAVLAGCVVTAHAAIAASGTAEGAAAFVRGFADQGISLLEDRSAPASVQAERFRQLVNDYFSMDAIARFVLGRYANVATPAELEEYRRLFEDVVVYGYVKRFSEYSGERVNILRTADTPDNATIVFSQINRPSGAPPVQVSWRIGKRNQDYRIVDVIIENVSLAQTWRSDFSASMQQSGNSMPVFLQLLRDKRAELRKDLGLGP